MLFENEIWNFCWIGDFGHFLKRRGLSYSWALLMAALPLSPPPSFNQTPKGQNTTRAMCVKIMWKRCEKCVKKRNHVKSMLEKREVHHISISHACELFDMRVKFCNTCEKFLSYVWTFFPCILLHVKSFHTCETILSCMWTSNFTCIIDAMHVKFFTCMWTLLGMSEWACEFLGGLVKCNHYEPYFYENAMNF